MIFIGSFRRWLLLFARNQRTYRPCSAPCRSRWWCPSSTSCRSGCLRFGLPSRCCRCNGWGWCWYFFSFNFRLGFVFLWQGDQEQRLFHLIFLLFQSFERRAWLILIHLELIPDSLVLNEFEISILGGGFSFFQFKIKTLWNRKNLILPNCVFALVQHDDKASPQGN